MTSEFRAGVRQRRVGRKVRAWREALGLTGAAAAKAMKWSPAKLSKLENATQPVNPVDVLAFGLTFHIDEDERTRLYYDAQRAVEPGWWHAYDDTELTESGQDYVELESEASVLRTFTLDVVPSILRTPEYVGALVRADLPDVGEDIVRRRIEITDRRQELLRSDKSLQVDAVLTEGALRTEVGGPDVLRDQLATLAKLADLPNVSIRVVPFSVGAYPAMGSPFDILTFDETNYEDVVYLDSAGSGVLFQDSTTVGRYMLRFVGVREIALDVSTSRAMIARAAETAGR